MLYSTIKLYHKPSGWSVKINHSGRVSTSGNYKNAADAYAAAECLLVNKPGYVQVVPKEDR